MKNQKILKLSENELGEVTGGVNKDVLRAYVEGCIGGFIRGPYGIYKGICEIDDVESGDLPPSDDLVAEGVALCVGGSVSTACVLACALGITAKIVRNKTRGKKKSK